MSYPRYDQYKDSGIEWLKEIPSHWAINKIKHSTYLKGRVGWHGLNSEEFSDQGIHLVTGKDFQRSIVNWETCYRISESRYAEDPYIHLREDDLLITKDGTIGKLARVKNLPNRATLNSGIFLVRPMHEMYVTDYMYWVLDADAFKYFVDLNKTGSTIVHLYQEILDEFIFPTPSLPEQRAIAAFLDRETSCIDGLITKQEQMIALLHEKRKALISHLVTHGLNPNVHTKDSGVEWLGTVPQHWHVKPFKQCCTITEGQVDPKDEQFRNITLIAPNHIESGTGRVMFMETAEDQGAISGKYIVKSGEIIYSKIRPALNKVCIAEEDCLCSADMYPIRSKQFIITRFLLYYFLSEPFVHLMVDESMRVAMPKVNRETLTVCPIVIPPMDEQQAIVSYLDHEIAKIDTLIDKAQAAIHLLKEHRMSLISAAVTGKIDVRGLGGRDSHDQAS